VAIAGSRAGGYGKPTKLAKFKCTSCSFHYEEKPGGTKCPKCQCLYVTWVNYLEWEVEVAKQDAELAAQARRTAEDSVNKAKAALTKAKKDKRKRKASAKQRKRK
jgi:hypothetical protein